MSAAEIAKREFGSKCLLAGWNFYVTLIFTLKGVMLCFYSRMTYAQDPFYIHCLFVSLFADLFLGLVFGRESLLSGRRSVQCSHISVSLPPSGGTVLLYTRIGRFILTQAVSCVQSTLYNSSDLEQNLVRSRLLTISPWWCSTLCKLLLVHQKTTIHLTQT